MRTPQRASIVLERWLLIAGGILVGIWLAALADAKIASRLALWNFANAQAAAVNKVAPSKATESGQDVDFSLWAPKRIQAYKDSLVNASNSPLAVLQIDRVKIRVPVFEGTDDLTLNRGAGRIAGTASLGDRGNVGIAGHRDGFFRGLKDISVGDQVDLVTTTKRLVYVVDQIEIVSPEDVRVLEPRANPSLTLVTCYPFYFVGDAPQRFIVHASIVSSGPATGSGNQSATNSAGPGKTNKEN